MPMTKRVNGVQVEMDADEEQAFLEQQALDAAPPTAQDLEAEVDALADQLTQSDERLMALALATVDLRMADITGMDAAQVRQAFRARVVHYLRQRRGI